MFAEPDDLDLERLAAVVADDWSRAFVSLTYQPVGFGTHHYLGLDTNGDRWFVNVDELAAKSWLASTPDAAFDALDRSLRTAMALADAGLEFVHAPVERKDGGVVARLGNRFAVSLFEFVDGSSNEWGEYTSDDERLLVAEAVARIHSATDLVPRDIPRRVTFEIPDRAEFFDSLERLDAPWTGGPYSEPMRDLLRAKGPAIRGLFDTYDGLVRQVGARRSPWVVTHGEPHAANVMRPASGGILLIDWDTAAVAPAERDLWMVDPGSAEADPAAIELYRMLWALSEITGYTATFRGPHADDANTRAAWEGLKEYIPD